MARETRVGLIAGLAFIICFALILANRGDQFRRPTTNARQADPEPMASGDWQVPSSPPQDPKAMPGTPESDEALLALRSAAPDVPSSRLSELERRLEALAASLDTKGNGGRTPAPKPVSTGDPADTAADVKPQAPETGPATAASYETAPVRYRVNPGDTLSQIASRFYGSRSARCVDAIFDANRERLESPDMLRVGMELVIPDIDGAQAKAKSLPEAGRVAAGASAENQDSGTGASFTWYQIERNDGYANIARAQLGDANRWREIHELNKDKFPDPQRIREGVRIKLPAQKVAGSTERRR